MISKQIRQIVHELLQSLPSDIRPVHSYVYGSRARGDAEDYSDLDVLIELREDADRTVKNIVREKAWELSLAYGFMISPVVVSEADFEDGPLAHSGFAQNIHREGIEVAA